MEKLTPDDADRLFSSTVDENDPALGALSSFVREAREAYTRAPDAAVQARHLRAIADELAARPESHPVRRRRRVPIGRAAAAALAGSVLVAGSALAATGHLPGPAQDAVAGLVSHVGVTLPTPSDAGKARAEANKRRAELFTKMKKDWTQCVEQNARTHTEAVCGPKPKAQDFQPSRNNPAGHPNHGKGPQPGGVGPSSAGNNGEGNGPGKSGDHPTPAASQHGNPHTSDGTSPGHGQGSGRH